MWYVYILGTKSGHLYTGTTNDVPRRVNEHKEGKGARYTRIFGFKKLLYQEECPTKSHALKREAQIQGWTRKKKLALIKDDLELLRVGKRGQSDPFSECRLKFIRIIRI